MKATHFQWEKLESPRSVVKNDYFQVSDPLSLNSNEFVIFPHWPDVINDHDLKHVGILRYTISDNKWDLFMPYSSVYNPQWNHVCIDAKHQKVYSSGNRSSLTMIDLDKKTFHPLISSDKYKTAHVLSIDSETLYFIGGSKGTGHYIWNNKTLKEIYKFTDFGKKCKGITGFNLVHINSQKKLLMLGGYLYGKKEQDSRIDFIFEHEIGTQKWNKLNVTLPHKMNSFGCILSSDEKYLIIIGGVSSCAFQDIHVMNLCNYNMIKSTISLPSSDIFHSIKTCESSKIPNITLIHGYIHQEKKMLGLSVPEDIIKLIEKYYSIEYIYILGSKLELYRIKLNDVLLSCQV